MPQRYGGNGDDLDQPQPGLVVAARHLGFYGVDDYPGWVTTSGCILQTLAPKRQLTEGPWRVTCPAVAVTGG